MARLIVEDSEDEFPDLDKLLRGDIPARGKEATGSTTRSRETGNCEEKGTTKKKRALKRRDDNPLLKPLAFQEDGGRRVKSRAKPVERVLAERSRSKSVESEGMQEEAHGTTASRRNGKKATPILDSDEDEEVENRVPSTRPRSKGPVVLDLETEDESDGLSDFIVNDSTFVEEEPSENGIPLPSNPPRSVRRLVKGRRRKAEDEELELDMKGLMVKDDTSDKIARDFGGSEDGNSIFPARGSKGSQRTKSNAVKDVPRPKKKVLEPGSDIEDAYTLRL